MVDYAAKPAKLAEYCLFTLLAILLADLARSLSNIYFRLTSPLLCPSILPSFFPPVSSTYHYLFILQLGGWPL